MEPAPGQRRYADRQDVFRLEPEAPLRASLGFVQWFPEPKQFRLFVLLNYRQAVFGFQPLAPVAVTGGDPMASPAAGPPSKTLHHVSEFTAPPDEELYFELWTEPLAAGYYDLALIVVPDPYQNQRDLPYFTTGRASTRASVYVGEGATPPAVDFPPIDLTPAANSGFSELLWFGQEPRKTRLKPEQVVGAGEQVTLIVNYQPHVDNLADDLPPDTPLPVAFVAVLDDRVVPIDGQPVLYGSAVPGTLSYLPVTIRVPDEPGTYQVFVQQFPNPYTDAKEAEATGREYVGVSSQRFILDAE